MAVAVALCDCGLGTGDQGGDRRADPLVRSATSRALPAAPPRALIQAIAPLLSDPVHAATSRRAGARENRSLGAGAAAATAFVKATGEVTTAEGVDAHRPEAHLNLRLLEMRRGDPSNPDSKYRTALRLDPAFVSALIDLADLDRARGMDEQGAELLRKAMPIEPNNAAVLHSLGLLLVRQHDYASALDLLRRACERAPIMLAMPMSTPSR